MHVKFQQKNVSRCAQNQEKDKETSKSKKNEKKYTWMLLDSNPLVLSAKTLNYPLGYRGIVIIFVQVVIVKQSKAHFFTKIHEDWVKGHWIFICLGSILTNNTCRLKLIMLWHLCSFKLHILRIYTQTKKIRPIFMVLYLLIQLRCLSKKYTKMFIKRPTHKSW